jgi:hypothetical protein
MSKLQEAADWLERAADIYGDDPALEQEISSLALHLREVSKSTEGVQKVWILDKWWYGHYGRDYKTLPENGVFLSKESAQAEADRQNAREQEFYADGKYHNGDQSEYTIDEHDLYE